MSSETPEAVIITGATGHVGAALVARLLPRMRLSLLGRDLTRLRTTLDSGARVALISEVDLTDPDSVKAGVDKARALQGPARALVHTVGGYLGGSDVLAQDVDGFRHMLDVNFWSAVHLVKAVLPDVIAASHGRIVLFASGDALKARAGAAAYAASKAALLRFAEGLAEEVAPHGVGVRVIVPTTIDTEANRRAMPDAAFDRWVTLDEVANAVEFALSPASSGMRFGTLSLGG